MFWSVLLRPWLEYSEYSALPTEHYESILQEQHVKGRIQRRVARKEQKHQVMNNQENGGLSQRSTGLRHKHHLSPSVTLKGDQTWSLWPQDTELTACFPVHSCLLSKLGFAPTISIPTWLQQPRLFPYKATTPTCIQGKHYGKTDLSFK